MPATLPITNPNPKSGETQVNIYSYIPWRGLGLTAVILFAICFVMHSAYAILAIARQRRRQQQQQDQKQMQQFVDTVSSKGVTIFEILFSIGCLIEIIGYAFRSASSSDPYRLVFFILNYFMIIVAPVFFSAALYYCLSLVLQQMDTYAALVPLSGRSIVKIFVLADVVTILIQVVGAALIGVSESSLADNKTPPLTPTQANDILLAGLSIQVFSFTIFLALLFTLLIRLLRRRDLKLDKRRQAFFCVLVSSSILVYTRTVFRLVESAMGVESAATRNQGLFAALETVPIMVTVLLWTIFPLSALLVQPPATSTTTSKVESIEQQS